jgi:DNA (cytosine-5)-methyltransferase 1
MIAGPGLVAPCLFTGCGGLDLAAKSVFGARPVWFADNDPDAARVLKHHHRRIPNLGDITALDFADRVAVPGIDILAAGWPCQDISIAGRGEGLKKGNRSGLWFTVAAAVRDLRPDLVLLENVAQLRRRGLDQVQADLAGSGYHTEWLCLRASEVGAPHRRARMFVLAWRPCERADQLLATAAAHPDRFGWHTRAGLREGEASRCRRGRSHYSDGAHQHQPAATKPTAVPDAESFRRAEGRAEPARVKRRPDAHLCDRTTGPAPGRARRGAALTTLTGHSSYPWGVYTDAVRRWEHVLGRPAPDPTQPGRHGHPRMRPEFSAWLMGLPTDDYLAAVSDVSRIAALRLAGNGVVPHQAETAFRELARRACDYGQQHSAGP